MRSDRTMPSDNQVLKVKKLSEILRIHITTLYRLIREGKIPGFRVGAEWRVRADEIEAG
jgi:excisionase family DNA binding protein